MTLIDRIYFDKTFDGDGWHGEETASREDGSPFSYRWLPSGYQASVTVKYSDLGACIAQCDIISILDPVALDLLEIRVDDKKVASLYNPEDGKLSFIIPSSISRFAEISFLVPIVLHASELDQRQLSMAFSEINIFQLAPSHIYDMLGVSFK